MNSLSHPEASAVLEHFRRLPMPVRKELLKRLIDEVDRAVPTRAAQTQAPDEPGGAELQLPMTPRFIRRVGPPPDRSRERAWLAAHRDEYAGQWVAVEGERLIAHGPELADVRREAQEAGVPQALFLFVEGGDALPFVGL
jgi:hypothetical protein